MKFLLDAHLPPSLCQIIERRGHGALTTRDLPCGNGSSDEQIRTFAEPHDWIVVSKDKDFYYSHILSQNPRKLLLVRCGNLRLRDLLALFEQHIIEIEAAFQKGDLVELFSDRVGE